MNKRAFHKAVNNVMFSLTGFCTVATIGALLFILGYLAWNGATALNWDFFTKLPTPVGQTGGGMANAIVGSGKLLLIASLIGIPIGFLGGVYLSEFGGKTFSFLVRYSADLLNGMPSIVIGIVAYGLIVAPVKHFSTFAGGVALGIMMIPIALRTTEEYLRSVPKQLREGALALGTPKWRMVATVVVPAAMQGIVSGMLLDLARVAGETAPLLFTSFSNRFWSPGWDQATASLPVMIFTYAVAPYEDWHRQAWAAGFVLLTLILLVNIVAKLVLARGRHPAH
jgi:phosphate transport system permease protein